MKTIQLVGSRNKSDFTIYLSHLLTKLDQRVLIVDTTERGIYQHGIARLNGNQHLYDFQQIDILAGAKEWLDVEELLRIEGESTTNYDTVIVDMDSTKIISNEWPIFEERYYIGDEERLNQMQDIDLLHLLFDETEDKNIKRVTFKSGYELTGDYFDNLLNHRATWRSMNHMIEPDEFMISLRIQMGHDHIIPFKKVNKQYKDVLCEIVSEIYEMHIKEVQDAVKTSFFKFGTKRVKKEKTKERALVIGSSN
ncbi:hypothetical protein MKX53_19280 [Psychrobacillus sp. FSL K6-4615]|uniref:hypothetical protein n=1 Tax=Psychrobacillus sp. FSL K6-4615 TaxID=2921551 RepID=UPI0030F7DA07